jgi:hypothetical protein
VVYRGYLRLLPAPASISGLDKLDGAALNQVHALLGWLSRVCLPLEPIIDEMTTLMLAEFDAEPDLMCAQRRAPETWQGASICSIRRQARFNGAVPPSPTLWGEASIGSWCFTAGGSICPTWQIII